MTVRPQPREVKQLVVRTFLGLGGTPETLFDLKETVFIDGGRYMARCYRTEELRAVWSPSDGVIQFYDSEAKPLRTVNLLEEEMPQLMAA
jgi:hypothetical protein